MFLIKEISLGVVLTWFLLILVENNEGGVVNINHPIAHEKMHRLTQQINSIRSQVEKEAFLWGRLANFAEDGDAERDGSTDSGTDTKKDDDPEVRPGLFQGDIALDLQMYKYWRVGLNWNAFPERMWPNRTVPYAISPLYEPEDQVSTTQCHFSSFKR